MGCWKSGVWVQYIPLLWGVGSPDSALGYGLWDAGAGGGEIVGSLLGRL